MSGIVTIISTTSGWQACFTGEDDNPPGAGPAVLSCGTLQTDAEAHMAQVWGPDELAPTCTENHLVHGGRAHRCTRTDCPILYVPPEVDQ